MTLTGDVLSPAVVRRMACEAGIIPVVLGRDGAPLGVGYRERLFTYSQRPPGPGGASGVCARAV